MYLFLFVIYNLYLIYKFIILVTKGFNKHIKSKISDLGLHNVLVNICPAYLHLEVSNVNAYDIGTSEYYVIFSLLFLLKCLFFIMIIIIVSGLVI